MKIVRKNELKKTHLLEGEKQLINGLDEKPY